MNRSSVYNKLKRQGYIKSIAKEMTKSGFDSLIGLVSLFAGIPPDRTMTQKDVNWMAKNIGKEVEVRIKKSFRGR